MACPLAHTPPPPPVPLAPIRPPTPAPPAPPAPRDGTVEPSEGGGLMGRPPTVRPMGRWPRGRGCGGGGACHPSCVCVQGSCA